MVTINQDDIIEIINVPKLDRLFILDAKGIWWRARVEDFDEGVDPEIEGEATQEEIQLISEVKVAVSELGKLTSWNPKDPEQRRWLIVLFPQILQIEYKLKNF